NIEYVEASPHNSELISLEVAEIVIPKVEEIEDDNLRKKLLNVHLLIANIEALKDNPTQSSELLTKSSSTSPKSFLEICENLSSTTCVNLPIEDDHSSLLAYVLSSIPGNLMTVAKGFYPPSLNFLSFNWESFQVWGNWVKLSDLKQALRG
nr:hypothetical protein [Tanacetum cinerariifolium]